MAVTVVAANTSRGFVEASGGGAGLAGGGTTMARAGTYVEVAGRPRWLCICMRMA